MVETPRLQAKQNSPKSLKDEGECCLTEVRGVESSRIIFTRRACRRITFDARREPSGFKPGVVQFLKLLIRGYPRTSAAKNVEGMNIACLQVGTISAVGE